MRALLAVLDDPEAGPEALTRAAAACARVFEELRRELDATDGTNPELTAEPEGLMCPTAVATGRVETEQESLLRDLGITRRALQAARSGQRQTGLGEGCDVSG